jgi:hypothetical protein
MEELREIVAARARLDDRELDLIDRARRQGATWAQIATALGLSSRQAAEQRRGRLAAAARARRHQQDLRYGLHSLRTEVTGVLTAITADPLWDARFVRAPLVRDTLTAAVDADAGPLFALAAQAATDLALAGPLPRDMRVAVRRLRRALREAIPLSTIH